MISLLLPERCVHCDRPSANSALGKRDQSLAKYLCDVCLRVTDKIDSPEDDILHDQLRTTAPHLTFKRCSAGFIFLQDSPVQSLIHSLKYKGMPKLGELLGLLTRERTQLGAAILVPIPLHRTRLAERGYNQAECIAKGLAQTPAELVQALKRTRPTPTQTSLSIAERQDNVRGAFALTRQASNIRDKHVILIDDVMTTGATLASAAETLLAAGPASISCITLSAARPTSEGV